MSLEGTRIGHVRIERLLGKGGMGEVYLGLDEKLERRVAVKVLTAERRLKPEAKVRFLREARLLSRLDDPGICRIYDLVEGGDTDYLILELVDGVILTEGVAAAHPDEEMLRLFLGVARALAAAHREGIVHRDLKPENVMVTGDGQVKVLDFGIARSRTAQVVAARGPCRADDVCPDERLARAAAALEPGLGPTGTMEPGDTESISPDLSEHQVRTLHTRVGSVMGTIRYMSPEQASGEEVTEASDLYSLGVMMQELLSGKPAYLSASGMDLLLKVYRAETVPITGVDPEVAALITELTRIDPAARPDAMAVADRLQHVLDRPQSERRRRLRFAAAAVVAAAIVAAAAVAVHARLQAGRRAELAQTFARQAEEISWRMRAEHLSPVHDIRPAKLEMRQRMQALESRMTELGDLAAGPGNAALGRAHLALDELDEARRHLEAAHAADFVSPEADFARGQVYGRLYREQLILVRGIRDPALKALELARIHGELRDPAIRLLGQTRSQNGVSSAYVEGVVALYEERLEDALEAVGAMVRAAPWFYEALELEGEIHRELSVRAGVVAADRTLERQEIGLAIDALERAAEIGRSDPGIFASLCSYRFRDMGATVLGTEPMTSPAKVEAAFAPCETALAIDAEAGGVESGRSGLLVVLAIAQRRHGYDANETWQKASDAAARAVAIEPESPAAHTARGWTEITRAHVERRSGGDPRAAAERSIVAYERALELLPGRLSLVVGICNSCYMAASFAVEKGDDPKAWIDRGVDRARLHLEASPDHAYLQEALGLLLTLRGGWQRDHGDGGRAALREAIEALEAANASAPNPELMHALAHARVELALANLREGLDPTLEAEAAADCARRSAELFPGHPYAFYLQGDSWLIMARYSWLAGQSPAEWLSLAVDEYERGIEASEDHQQVGQSGIAAASVLEARWRLEAGLEPRQALASARVAVAAALAKEPGFGETLFGLVELETLEARWRMRQGTSPAAAFAVAMEAADRAVGANHASAAGRLALAELHLWRARWLRGRGQPATEAVHSGLEAAAAALEINPRLGEAELVRGELELELAEVFGDTAGANEARPSASVFMSGSTQAR